MAVVSDQTIASVAVAAGFPRDEIATAVAVALAESGGDATAHNDDERDGSESFGLWQINSVHSGDLAAGNWTNPLDNARMARAVWGRAGGRWTPWGAFNDLRYLGFVARGQAAARSADESGATSDVATIADLNPFDDLAELRDQASGVLRVVTDRDLWVRVGIGALGAVLMVAAIVGLTWTLGGKQRLEKAVRVVAGAAPTGRAGRAAGAAAGAAAGSQTGESSDTPEGS